MTSDRKVGAILLCGGKSLRMGRAKMELPFGQELLLQRIVRLLEPLLDPIVVVADSTQQLPTLPSKVQVTFDRRPDCGPLEGLGAGLRQLSDQVERAYLTSCDAPFVVPKFVQFLVQQAPLAEVVVPCEGDKILPIPGLYRTDLADQVDALLDAGERRLRTVAKHRNATKVSLGEIRKFDPQLHALFNLNTPAEYRQALKWLGLKLPQALPEE